MMPRLTNAAERSRKENDMQDKHAIQHLIDQWGSEGCDLQYLADRVEQSIDYTLCVGSEDEVAMSVSFKSLLVSRCVHALVRALEEK